MNKFNYIFGLIFTTFILTSCSDDNTPLNIGDLRLVVYNLSFDETDEDREVTYYVRLMGDNPSNIAVSYATEDGTANSTADYGSLSGDVVAFSSGETIKEITLLIKGDFDEEDEEFFNIEFFSASGAFDPVTVKITINDNDILIINELTIPSEGYTTPLEYPGMDLVWNDEFDEGSLDGTSWRHEIGDGCPNLCGWGNNELQFYQEDNTTFEEDDYLVIEAKREIGGSNEYTSSRIITKNKREFQFGRIDIRAALPEGQGIWPALWMLGSNIDTNPWPACGEIDIMELIGHQPNRVYGTVHWGASFAERMENGTSIDLESGNKFSEEFHVFSLIWEENSMQILLDDEVYHTFTIGNIAGQPYPFNQPFYFVFNVAVGGLWPGNPDQTTIFPQFMIVDYVRVFQDT